MAMIVIQSIGKLTSTAGNTAKNIARNRKMNPKSTTDSIVLNRFVENLQRAFFAGLVVLLSIAAVQAGDWPQILGPHRSGQASGETLPDRWPANGPPVSWTYDLGLGYAGPAVVGDRVIVFHRVEKKERVEAIDVKTGRSLWQTDFTALYAGGINSDTGPRCVPVVHDGSVYVFGAAGDLHAVELATGKKRWSREAYADLGGDPGYFGAGSTPIVAGDKLLVNVGGRRTGAGIVAFALETGKTVWQATNDAASYSSPTLVDLAGKPAVIFVTRLNCVAIDPQTGTVLFSFPFGKSGPTVNAATPLVFDDHLFLSASYGIGAVYARIAAAGEQTIWRNDETMSSQYTTCVYSNGYLYGTHGREDFGDGEFRCIDAKSGKVRWSEPQFGIGNPILAGNKLLILKIDGKLILAEANPQKYQQLATASLTRDVTRALPALSNGRIYFRSNNDRGGKLFCVAVGAER
jgi:outer membrane protein assembly factor BamB